MFSDKTTIKLDKFTRTVYTVTWFHLHNSCSHFFGDEKKTIIKLVIKSSCGHCRMNGLVKTIDFQVFILFQLFITKKMNWAYASVRRRWPIHCVDRLTSSVIIHRSKDYTYEWQRETESQLNNHSTQICIGTSVLLQSKKNIFIIQCRLLL